MFIYFQLIIFLFLKNAVFLQVQSKTLNKGLETSNEGF